MWEVEEVEEEGGWGEEMVGKGEVMEARCHGSERIWKTVRG